MEPGDDLKRSIRKYLENHCDEYGITADWNSGRKVLSFRMVHLRGSEEPLLVEFAQDFLEYATPEDIDRLLGDMDLEKRVKDQHRVRVSRNGPEPLSRPEPAPEVDPVEEASEGSFPASDPPPHSAITRANEPKEC